MCSFRTLCVVLLAGLLVLAAGGPLASLSQAFSVRSSPTPVEEEVRAGVDWVAFGQVNAGSQRPTQRHKFRETPTDRDAVRNQLFHGRNSHFSIGGSAPTGRVPLRC